MNSLTEVFIPTDVKDTVTAVINEFKMDLNELLIKLAKFESFSKSNNPNRFITNANTVLLSAPEALVLKSIFQSQKEKISIRIIETEKLKISESETLRIYYRKLLNDLDKITFTDNVF